MSLRLEMLRAARRAPELLGDSADLVCRFLLAEQNPDGGFRNRAGQSDLYYLPFGLAGLAAVAGPEWKSSSYSSALQNTLSKTTDYLQGFGEGRHLDFIHLCSLVRSWAALREFQPELGPAAELQTIAQRLELNRTADGGYNPVPGGTHGSAYGACLALGAYQDLGQGVPNAPGLVGSLLQLETPEGGYTNQLSAGIVPAIPHHITTTHRPGVGAGTNATAAAVAVLRGLGAPVSDRVRTWLLARLHPGGGFIAGSTAPVPDLLSTATALNSLAVMGVAFEAIRELCLDYVDSLWTSAGGFYGYWGDDHLDCEYTFYGLLSLGHLNENNGKDETTAL